MRGAAKIIERLNKDMEELKLHKAGLVPNEEAMEKLETLIQTRKDALKDMGLDIEVHNLDNLGEEAAQTQCLFHGCEEPLKDALKLLAPGEANMDEYVDTEKDPMEGIFGSSVDGIAHSQAGSSRKPNIESMCGGCGDKNTSQKQAAEVPLKPELAMKKDVEDAEKPSEKPIEKDSTVNLFDEDANLLISHVCGEILGRRKKRSNIEERATPKKKAKAWYLSMAKLSWIGDVQELDEKVEDIAAKQDVEQDVDVTPNKVEEDQEPVVCPENEEILSNYPGWGYLVLNFCKIKKLIILDLNGIFMK
ncbi:hypothetical protein L7F22_057004 [Adiantum nelumboides]|nr:hypothetical protein [Adiantum nelumboides]